MSVQLEKRMTYPPGKENAFVGDDIMALYIHDTKKHPRLEPEDLNLLVKQVQMGIHANNELQMDADRSVQEFASLQETAERGRVARNEIVVTNTGLVFLWARKYLGRGVDFEDLIQAGNIGLMRAAEKFDPDKGFAFSTYAGGWIHAMVAQCVHEDSRTIPIPRNDSETLRMLRRKLQEHETLTGTKMSFEQLAEVTGRTVEKVKDLLSIEKTTESLHDTKFTGGEGKTELLDTLVDPSQPQVSDIGTEKVLEQQIIKQVRQLLAETALDDDSKRIIRLKYGFETGEQMNTVQVGKVIGWGRHKTTDRLMKAEAILREEALDSGLDAIGDLTPGFNE